ncbi:MAG: MFS transporter [Actinomycetota bacterium]|nr:MFS transporter [Actinomycetota bacterium]
MPAASVSGVARYRRLVTAPGAAAPLVLGTLARLPIGMTGLGLLLLVQQETGSFAWGGAVSGAYSAALAVASPLRGTAVDRRGPAAVLRAHGAVYPLALLATVAAALAHLPAPVLLVLAALSGAAFPPVGALVRSLWGLLFEDDADRATAYALDAVLIELAFVGGPLLVGVAVALGSPALAVGLSAALVAFGSLLLARAEVTARLVPHSDAPRAPLRAPLLSAPVRELLLAMVLFGIAFGATEVAVAAYAVDERAKHLAGPILATWAAGSVIGGLAYGARDWGAPAHRQYPWLVGLLGLAFLLPLAAPNPVSLAVLLLVAGAAIAPFSACNSALLARVAPPGASTATFAWSGSCIVAGAATGIGVAGWLVDDVGTTASFLLAAAAGLLALAVAILRRRYVGPGVEAG